MGDISLTNSGTSAAKDGISTFDQNTALTRLHYFDGKFLRADALTLEQNYHRTLVQLANIAGGWGVVHGLGINLNGDTLSLTPGLALTPAGGTVLLAANADFSVAKLVAAATAAPSLPAATDILGNEAFADCSNSGTMNTGSSNGIAYYEITVGPAQALCGNEEVYGLLCADSCVGDSQAPYWREGLILRLRPISLTLANSSAVPAATVHLRNRVASAYFAAEPWLASSLLSAAGLNGSVWCNPASLYTRDEVPLGLLVRDGTTTSFIDAWSARRERMDTQARGYWQGRMMMRPWNVFLAQILQFQCQLSGAFQPGSGGFVPDNDCNNLRQLLNESLRQLELTRLSYAASNTKILAMLGANASGTDTLQLLNSPMQQLQMLTKSLNDAKSNFTVLPANRLLLNSGFYDLPPAGYLPVVVGKQAINDQLQRMFGEGVNLHFCTARPDYIPHAVEQAEHMQRISLTQGLDDPQNKEDVEIFVPNGSISRGVANSNDVYWLVKMRSPLVSALIKSFGLLDNPARKLADAVQFRAAIFDQAGSTSTTASAGTMDTITHINNNVMMAGIARSARTSNGGALLTLVSSSADSSTNIIAGHYPRQDQLSLLGSPYLQHFNSNSATGSSGTDTSNSPVQGIYADMEITGNAFGGQEGDQFPVRMEWRGLETISTTVNDNTQTVLQGDILTGFGQLTVNAIYPVDNNVTGLDATVELQLTMQTVTADGSNNFTQSLSPTITLTLYQQGDAGTGQVLLFPTNSRYRTVNWELDWKGRPRTALFGLRPDTRNVSAMTAETSDTLQLNTASDSLANYQINNNYTQANDTFQPYLALEESDAPRTKENPARLDAINTLAAIASATQDGSFLTRARTRLFPDTMANTGGVQVTATLDWVMFRRQRKAACDTSCDCVTTSSTTSFQGWHLLVNDYAELKMVESALIHNDTTLLQQYQFRRVDVLHFVGDSLSPLETVRSLISDWTAAQPANSVGYANIWENAAQSVSGGTDLLRLKRLVQTLSAVFYAPPDSNYAVLQQAPGPLADAQFDGGFILLTVPEATIVGISAIRSETGGPATIATKAGVDTLPQLSSAQILLDTHAGISGIGAASSVQASPGVDVLPNVQTLSATASSSAEVARMTVAPVLPSGQVSASPLAPEKLNLQPLLNTANLATLAAVAPLKPLSGIDVIPNLQPTVAQPILRLFLVSAAEATALEQTLADSANKVFDQLSKLATGGSDIHLDNLSVDLVSAQSEYNKLKAVSGNAIELVAVNAPDTDVSGAHLQAVVKALGVNIQPGRSVYHTADSDFGDGATLAVIVFYVAG